MELVHPGPLEAVSGFGIADPIGSRAVPIVARISETVPHPVSIAVLDDSGMRECLLVVRRTNTQMVWANPIDAILGECVLDDIDRFVTPLDLNPSHPRDVPHPPKTVVVLGVASTQRGF